jgi:hypothetical protein
LPHHQFPSRRSLLSFLEVETFYLHVREEVGLLFLNWHFIAVQKNRSHHSLLLPPQMAHPPRCSIKTNIRLSTPRVSLPVKIKSIKTESDPEYTATVFSDAPEQNLVFFKLLQGINTALYLFHGMDERLPTILSVCTDKVSCTDFSLPLLPKTILLVNPSLPLFPLSRVPLLTRQRNY